VAEKRVVSQDAMEARTQAWRRAYLATPHGQLVDLSAGLREP
jgi:hypothetical protein